jgi:WD40 repeat protein
MTSVDYHDNDNDIATKKQRKGNICFENLIIKRRKNIFCILKEFFPNDLSNLISEYDYHLHGESYTFKKYEINNEFFDSMCFCMLSNEQIIIGMNNNLSVWNIVTGQRSNCPSSKGPEGKCEIENNIGHVIYDIFVLSDKTICTISDGILLNVMNYPYKIFNKPFIAAKVYCVLSDKRLVTVYDGKIHIWNKSIELLDYKYDLVFISENKGITCVTELHDGRIITGSYDGTLSIWNLQTGVCDVTLAGNYDAIYCINTLFDGRVVIGTYDGTLKILNVHLWEKTKKISPVQHSTRDYEITCKGHHYPVLCAAILPDGYVISGSVDKTIKLWDLANGQCEKTFTYHNAIIEQIVVLSDGRIITRSDDNIIKIMC